MTSRTTHAWAIDTRERRTGFVGVAWLFSDEALPVPCDPVGNRIATFDTRSEAREALAHVLPRYPHSQVVKVCVTVEVVQ